jgi:hypothetical protein
MSDQRPQPLTSFEIDNTDDYTPITLDVQGRMRVVCPNCRAKGLVDQVVVDWSPDE